MDYLYLLLTNVGFEEDMNIGIGIWQRSLRKMNCSSHSMQHRAGWII